MREKLYQYEEEELRAYFPLPRVLDGLFSLAQRLFGIEIRSVPTTTSATEAEKTSAVQVWHEDVQFFEVIDSASKQHIASFYLDPYSR